MRKCKLRSVRYVICFFLCNFSVFFSSQNSFDFLALALATWIYFKFFHDNAFVWHICLCSVSKYQQGLFSRRKKQKSILFASSLNNFCHFIYAVFVNGTATSKNKSNVDVKAFRWYGQHLSENLFSFMQVWKGLSHLFPVYRDVHNILSLILLFSIKQLIPNKTRMYFW